MTGSDGDALRRAFAALAVDAAPTALCPAPEALWNAVAGQAPRGEAERLVLHIAECPSCAEAWRLARELSPRQRSSPRAERRSGTRGSGRGSALLAAAAGLVLALVALVTRPAATTAPPAFREGEAPVLHSLVAEATALPRSRCVLRWAGGPASARYTLRVTTESLETLVHVRGLERPEYAVPESSLSGVPPGGRVLWRVDAVAADGSRTAGPTFVSRID